MAPLARLSAPLLSDTKQITQSSERQRDNRGGRLEWRLVIDRHRFKAWDLT
ncbi:hypothetical protein DFO67_10527 [Modicisalibacter xianhensis]|uniref:Uncharacterized protein n=1 Tax=Modicisalibacter xianhensis TaxID=442341 RepID=A0A4R8G193_9GAMM|nr:hypothetical protein DFO67_10527 [Halomonas xianhensis]